MNKIKNISIFGTSSDAGKSTLTFVIGKILQDARKKSIREDSITHNLIKE